METNVEKDGNRPGIFDAASLETELEAAFNRLDWESEKQPTGRPAELSMTRNKDGTVTPVEMLDTKASDICDSIADSKGYITLVPLTKAEDIKDELDTLTRIKLRRRIGKGGCGSVYYGQARVTGSPPLAVKVSNGVELSDLLRQEVAAATLIPEHKCVHRLWGAGECRETGTLVVASPFIEGMDLARLGEMYAEHNSFLPPLVVGLLGMRMLQGLGHLHCTMDHNGKRRPAFSHRDIKPANVMVEKNGGLVKLVDLGGVKPGLDAHGRAMLEAEWIGTPHYLHAAAMDDRISPVGEPFNYAANDVHAVGTVLYELLTGTLPWPTSIIMEYDDTATPADLNKMSQSVIAERYLLAKSMCVADKPLLSPRDLRPSIPKVLSDIVMAMLEKDIKKLEPVSERDGRVVPTAIRFAQRLQNEYVHSAIYGLGMGIQDASIPAMLRIAGPGVVSGKMDLSDNVLLKPLCVANYFEQGHKAALAAGGVGRKDSHTVVGLFKDSISYCADAIRYPYRTEIGPLAVKSITGSFGKNWQEIYDGLIDDRLPDAGAKCPNADDAKIRMVAERALFNDYIGKVGLHGQEVRR